jgi:Caspase domain
MCGKITCLASFRKSGIAGLLLMALLLCKPSFGNGGILRRVTLVLVQSQFPAAVKIYKPSKVYLLYQGPGLFLSNKFDGLFLRGDTITHLKKFTDSAGSVITGFRLIYQSNGITDSVWQLDSRFRITDKAYNLGNELLQILAFDSTMKKTDEFVFNYGQKLTEGLTRGGSGGGGGGTLESLLRQYEFYTSYDRNNYALSSVWILSIGIDDYGPVKYQTCKTDARSYTDFFKKQYAGVKYTAISGSLFHEYVLLDKEASKEAILTALKEIARKASFNDYFIFNFSGCSNEIKNDPVNAGAYFFPYDVIVTNHQNDILNRNDKDTNDPFKNCISLKLLQEYIQLIPANNQLFISEAGPSGKF